MDLPSLLVPLLRASSRVSNTVDLHLYPLETPHRGPAWPLASSVGPGPAPAQGTPFIFIPLFGIQCSCLDREMTGAGQSHHHLSTVNYRQSAERGEVVAPLPLLLIARLYCQE